VSATRTPVILVINSLPAVNASADMILCNGQKLQISDANAVNVSSITWTTSGTGKLTGSNSLNPEYQPSSGEYGLVRFILSGKGSGGCSETVISDTLLVTYQKPLIVDAGKDTSILANTTAILSVKVGNGSGNYTYQWSPGSSVVNNNKAATETIPLKASTQFLITAKDATSGCSSEDDIRITVEESIDDMLLITNGITPNGDGNNDVWKIRGIDSFPDNEVIIFNRWGDRIKMLKHYDNVNVFWDGTNEHGKLVPDGTYYYVLTIKDRKTYKGWIQLKSSL
jgi:gliding motility-associated-like protein